MDDVQTLTVDLNQAPAAVEPSVAAPAVPGFTGERGNFTADMAALKAELEPSPVVPVVQTETIQPATTETATAPETVVPDKFKAADGSLDASKVEKSTVDAEAALAKYTALEKVLRQKMNDANRLSKQTITPDVAPSPAVANQGQLTAFETQVANDIFSQGGFTEQQAISLARVQVKMTEARYNAEASLTETLRAKLEDQERRSELEVIAKYDQSVLTPEGFEALSKIRESKPWINQSPKPWTEAYDYYLADQTKKQRQTGTVLPTPTGLTAKAPPTPVGPAPRAVVQTNALDMTSQASIDAHVKGLSHEAEAAFWKSKGLRF